MPKRVDGNQFEESRGHDTRRWQGTNNQGHIPGSKLAQSGEQQSEELRKKEDESGLNQLDDRDSVTGDERS